MRAFCVTPEQGMWFVTQFLTQTESQCQVAGQGGGWGVGGRWGREGLKSVSK